MTLKTQFNLMIEFFNQRNFDYAVVGAFALFAYGYTRATSDIDFITRNEYQDTIVRHLESLGFETLHRSEGFSNHLNPTEAVRIDLVYIDPETAGIIFEASQRKTILGNLELSVVSPEHLLALKLFAVKNDPDRKFKEFADIKELLKMVEMEKDLVYESFKKYGLEDYFDEIAGEQEKDNRS
ncbi:MAG: nucleotidyl transferase AbiEii/AbiGii toxin family protein [Thermodesulfobacteriota bacterium]